jgi:hypothetical protein
MSSSQVKGRALVYGLLDILYTMRGSRFLNEEFYEFLTKHIEWLSNLMEESYDSDAKLYLPIYKHLLIELVNFLKYPERHIEYFDLVFSEYYDIVINCRRFDRNYDGNEEEYHNMEDFFKSYVSKLDYISANTDYTIMKEQNRELYHDLNKYILKPERIDKIADKFGMNFCEYLDAIDV